MKSDRRTLSLAPEHIGRKWTTMVDESTLNLTVILHGTTQTRCIVVPKANGNALITLHNISCPFFRSFTIVSSQSCPESTARFTQSIQRENNHDTHKPKHSIENTPAPNIVHIRTTPWSCSRQPLPLSQIPNLFKIHYFRLVFPS